ncbi:MAG: hypothetical protein Q8K86_05780 [Candidatus Nanopelagicaceae bacterium]|nr:hypothetical protein [Candidatus Nanopelagicaceae bacterium]
MGKIALGMSRFKAGSYQVSDSRTNLVVTPSESTNLEEIYLASSQWVDISVTPLGYPGYNQSNGFEGALLPEIANRHEDVMSVGWVTGSWIQLAMAGGYANEAFDMAVMPQRLQDPDNGVPNMGAQTEVFTHVVFMDETDATAGVLPTNKVVGRFNFTRSKGLCPTPTPSVGWPPVM